VSARKFSPQAFTKSGPLLDQQFMQVISKDLDGSLGQKWKVITGTGVSIGLRKGETPLQM